MAFHDRAGLDRLEQAGLLLDRVESEPLALASLTSAQVREVAAWPETWSLHENAALDLYLDESVAMIGAKDVHEGRGLRAPYTGAGVGVAVIDTGTDTTHPDLPYGAKVKRNFYVVANPFGSSPRNTVFAESLQTDTEHGHGTHVASTIAGTGAASGGRYGGVAPGADIYSFKAGAGPSVLTWWTVRAFDWIVTNGEALNIRVVSNSWGGGDGSDYDPSDPVNIMTKRSYEEGIVVLFAAGNSGGPNKLNEYAVSPYVVSVGAVDKSGTKASFTSVGRPGGDMVRDENGLYRPTVMAPGVDILAARSSAGVVMSTGVDAENPFYTSADGTSMATPHVAGVVALMLQARPALTPAHVIAILEGTADAMDAYETWEVGAGLVDAHAATQAAEKGRVKFPPATGGKTPAYVLREGASYAGTILPAGYTTKAATDAGVLSVPVTVGAGVDALFADLSWGSITENVYLFLDDPSGREVASSAGLLDIGEVTYRTVAVTNPTPGEWTIRVEGRVNTITDVSGSWGLYDENTKTRTDGTATTTSTAFDGTLGPAVVAGDTRWHDIVVPTGASALDVYVEWSAPTWDIDLYIYDPSGRQVTYSAAGDTRFERATVTTGHPMTGELAPGVWRAEVRGYLTVSEAYNGTATITARA